MPTLIILAAGIGSRYGGLKQIDPVGPHDQIILDYSIYDAIEAGFDRVVFVIRREIERDFRDFIGGKYEKVIPCTYVYQELDALPQGINLPADRTKPWGTAHAVWVCESVVKEPFAVINADDFYGKIAYRKLLQFLDGAAKDVPKSTYAMVGFALENTLSQHGSVSRGVCNVTDDGTLETITERTKIQHRQDEIQYQDSDGTWHSLAGSESVSMNFWGFTPSIFPHLEETFITFLENHIHEPKSEFFLPITIDTLLKEDRAQVSVLPSPDQWVGVTYPEDKPQVTRHLMSLIASDVYPEKLWS
ncbi:MAG: sugar phosphate nucleotidyltransferase [Desulfobacterales bacterium]